MDGFLSSTNNNNEVDKVAVEKEGYVYVFQNENSIRKVILKTLLSRKHKIDSASNTNNTRLNGFLVSPYIFFGILNI